MLRKALFAAAALVSVHTANAGTIFSYDFNGSNLWTETSTDVAPSTPLPIEPSYETKPVGTIDVAKTSDPSGGLLLKAEVGDAVGEWHAMFISGLLPVINAEINLAKLTLAFDYSVSISRPITVRFESFDAGKKRTGGLETVIYPAAPNFYIRAAIDLSTMKKFGGGVFQPTDPFVQISYVISGPDFPSSTTHELRIDNVHYASPAYYVSPKGSDSNDGLTENTPFLLPQKAVDLAKPGDIVLLMEGEYRRPASNTVQDGIMHIESAGTPAAWITYKNFPGQKPVIINEDSWCAIRVGGPVRLQQYKDTPVAYTELRGLHVRGLADKVMENYKADLGLPKPTTNGNGISGGGVKGGIPCHHLRVADCIAEYNPGGGIGFGDSDRLYYENNIARYNSWFVIYATSGMGTIGTSNFDTADNVHKILLRNNRVSWNRTYLAWAKIKKVSDGNGIIVDVNNDPAKAEKYLGRILIQNNIATHNGGSGIHCFKAHQVDIVNNTAFMNGASPELRWGQIFVQRGNDIKVVNNILYARDGQPVNTVGKDITDKGNTNVLRANNIYFGGGYKPIMGENDIVGDPEFLEPWLTTWESPTFANFRVRPTSPAIGKGKWDAYVPLTDIDGKPRPIGGPIDIGAFQHTTTERK